MAIRPRRSVLYMPGSNARAIEKAKTLPADGVIIDLEDAVAPDAKVAARKQVADAVKAGGFGNREVFIRVNGIDTEWHADDLHDAAHAATGRHCGAESLELRAARNDRPPPARHVGAAQDADLGDDRDADRDPECEGHRGRGGGFRNAACGIYLGHERSRQGNRREIRSRPRADAALACDLHSRRARLRHFHSRRRL